MLPKISFVIPTLNEEKRITGILRSIFEQEYPKDKIEVIIVDNYSTDKTVDIVKKFPVKVILNKIKNPEVSKMMGFKICSGEFITYAEGDLKLRDDNWLKKMVKPLLEDKNICASFTRYYKEESDAPINKYLTLDPLQRDAFYRYFSCGPEETIINKKDGYSLCIFKKNKIPPMGLALYRKSDIWPLIKSMNSFMELDNLVRLVESGKDRFAYVDSAGYYHCHANSLYELLKKRLRNLDYVYLPNLSQRKYKWINMSTPGGVLKIAAWTIYSNTIILPLIVGIFRSIKYKSVYALYEPVVAFLLTDLLIFRLLSTSSGRALFIKK